MTHPDAPRAPPDWPARIVAIAAVFAVVGGLVTLAGWIADVPRLTDWKNDSISMFPGQDSDRQRAEDAGFDAHLVKPVPPDVVQRLLATVGRASTPGHVADAPA